MADTSQQALSEPHTNGAVDGLTEEEKSKMRPADIDAVSSSRPRLVRRSCGHRASAARGETWRAFGDENLTTIDTQ